MASILLKISIGTFIIIWFFVCLSVYKSTRKAAWLAGSTVASCLFFLGTTVAISLLVKQAFLLAPLWAAILILLRIHLKAAQRHNSHLSSYSGEEQTASPFPLASPTGDKPPDLYI